MFLALTLACTFAEPPGPAPPPRLVGEFVELKTPTGTLHGIIDVPSTPGPWPVVLIHPGSGPTDRDGNSRQGPITVMRNDSVKMLGRGLASRGIAALRIDKRGIAASAAALGKVEELRAETYGDDAAMWVAWLRKDPRFTKVGIIGHSEGTLIGLLAARKEKVDALVCLCGLARPLQDVLRVQLKRALPMDLYNKADKIIQQLSDGHEVPKAEIPNELLALFRPAIQPYLISEFKLDPASILAKLDGPVLVVNGSTDVQVTVEDGKRLAAARKGCRLVVLDRMNHVLKETDKTTVADQLPIYMDWGIPLHQKLVGEIAGFINETMVR